MLINIVCSSSLSGDLRARCMQQLGQRLGQTSLEKAPAGRPHLYPSLWPPLSQPVQVRLDKGGGARGSVSSWHVEPNGSAQVLEAVTRSHIMELILTNLAPRSPYILQYAPPGDMKLQNRRFDRQTLRVNAWRGVAVLHHINPTKYCLQS